MNSMLSRSRRPKLAKGQDDHIDAWLISYADLITLLFMVFVIFVSVSSIKPSHSTTISHGKPEHPYLQKRSGTLALGTAYDEAYRVLEGVILSNRADQHIAVEKTNHGIIIDLSMMRFFEPGSADIPPDQLPVLKAIAQALKAHMRDDSFIAVEGHTDDMPPAGSPFANDWELSSMRAARIAGQLAAAGIDPARLRASGYAGAHPLVPNKDAAGNFIAKNQERNQRIIIKLERNPDIAPTAESP